MVWKPSLRQDVQYFKFEVLAKVNLNRLPSSWGWQIQHVLPSWSGAQSDAVLNNRWSPVVSWNYLFLTPSCASTSQECADLIEKKERIFLYTTIKKVNICLRAEWDYKLVAVNPTLRALDNKKKKGASFRIIAMIFLWLVKLPQLNRLFSNCGGIQELIIYSSLTHCDFFKEINLGPGLLFLPASSVCARLFS